MNLLFRKQKPKADRFTTPMPVDNASGQPDIGQPYQQIFDTVRDATMTSAERVGALCEAVEYVCRTGIVGDIVECGVWKGGSMMAVAKTLIQHGCTDRRLWLYDTFDGMSAPAEHDVDYLGTDARTLMERSDASDPHSVWCRSGLGEVQQRLESTGYPKSQIEFVCGDVEQTLLDESNHPAGLALLRLDTDWYQSTRVELEVLFPLLSPGGVLIIDDYGHWRGCRKAVDEYFAANQIRIFLHRIDYTGRIGIKQELPDFRRNCDAA